MNSCNHADIILKKQPAENSPYLNSTGVLAFILTLVSLLTAIVCWHFEFEDIAQMLTAAAAAALLFIAIDHAASILTWRALKTGDISPLIAINPQNLGENTVFTLTLTIRNPLRIPIYLHAVRWNHSENIQLQKTPDRRIYIPSQSEALFTFKAKTTHIGKSYIQGIGLLISSPIQCFNAEEHIPLQHQILILPKACASKHSNRFQKSMSGKTMSRILTLEADAELETMRPYQPSDSCRHISWRYFAKTQNLQVRQFSKNTEKPLICLLDAGPQMRLTRPDNTSNLGNALNLIACCANAFTSVTIIAYDENAAVIAAQNVHPRKLNAIMNQWVISELEWRPPTRINKDQMIIWNLAANQIHQDFKLYRHVDFSTKTKNGLKIDLKGLVNWAKADLALKANSNDDHATARKYIGISYQDMLTELVRKRCRMPQSQLMPNPPYTKLYQAVKLLKKQTKNAESSLIWLSDFASETSDETLKELSHAIAQRRTNALGICLPMPVHALNFIASHGIKQRERFMRFLGKDVEFIDHESGPDSGGAVSAKGR